MIKQHLLIGSETVAEASVDTKYVGGEYSLGNYLLRFNLILHGKHDLDLSNLTGVLKVVFQASNNRIEHKLGACVFENQSIKLNKEYSNAIHNCYYFFSPYQITEIEKQVNKIIQDNLPIECVEMSKVDAQKAGELGIFEEKYGDRVKVYSVGDYSKEICGGPHISHTGELGKFKITNEKSSSAGVRRIKAILE